MAAESVGALRPGLDPRDRSLVTVVALASTAQVDQIPFHLDRAMDNGLTAEEIDPLLRRAGPTADTPAPCGRRLPGIVLHQENTPDQGVWKLILNETYTLSNGVHIPKLGLGTWFIDDDKAADAVTAAVAIGYRNIDTAQAYGNERGVGEGIRASDVPREELFVSTKVAAEIKDYDDAAAAIDASLTALRLDHIDLMLIHSPQPWDNFRGGDYAEGNRATWRALEDAYQAGKLRSIGVSNFEQRDLDNILSACTVAPQVNQLLVHAGNTPTELLAYCDSKDILVQAYSPIAHGEILKNPDIRAMADRYGVTVPQLCIRYTLQLGTVSLPKTANPEHMRSNAQVDFVITADDMDALRNLQAQDYGEHSVFPVYSGK
ncbi:aldo/keto reductase [Nocardia sp. NPDC058499]|uniref:aldo/keto reductase n=1 Tax=Nocardia sp. NPDC058499 TaxID=3346530 RepID=UPI003646779B